MASLAHNPNLQISARRSTQSVLPVPLTLHHRSVSRLGICPGSQHVIQQPRSVAARWAENRRNIQDITHQDAFAPQKAFALQKRNGPLMVAYDGTPGAKSALEWTLQNLVYPADPDECVEVVHVVCDPQALTSHTGVGGRRSAADVDPSVSAAVRGYHERLQAQARVKLAAACGELLAKSGINFKIRTPQLYEPRSAAAIGEALMSAADDAGARALVVASHGPGVQADFGSVARYCYMHQELPLVLVPQMPPAPAAPENDRPGGAPGRTVLLVVSRLEELEAHWQWVVANCCRPHDTLHIWHINPPPANVAGGCGLASLPTVLDQAVKAYAGLANVFYRPVYHSLGAEGVAEEVRGATTTAPASTLVVVMNYHKSGLVAESLQGGTVASHLTRTCPVPLLVLEPPLM